MPSTTSSSPVKVRIIEQTPIKHQQFPRAEYHVVPLILNENQQTGNKVALPAGTVYDLLIHKDTKPSLKMNPSCPTIV